MLSGVALISATEPLCKQLHVALISATEPLYKQLHVALISATEPLYKQLHVALISATEPLCRQLHVALISATEPLCSADSFTLCCYAACGRVTCHLCLRSLTWCLTCVCGCGMFTKSAITYMCLRLWRVYLVCDHSPIIIIRMCVWGLFVIKHPCLRRPALGVTSLANRKPLPNVLNTWLSRGAWLWRVAGV